MAKQITLDRLINAYDRAYHKMELYQLKGRFILAHNMARHMTQISRLRAKLYILPNWEK